MDNCSRFIFECIRFFLGKGDPFKISDLYGRIGGSGLFNLANTHALEGMFFHINANGAFSETPLPEPLVNNLKHSAWKNDFENIASDTEAARICTVLQEQNIEYRYIKGALTRRAYPASYIRYSCDIDLFIKKSDYHMAKNALASIGYSLSKDFYEKYKLEISVDSYEEIASEITFSGKVGNRTQLVDLQWDFISMGGASIFNELYDINMLIFNSPVNYIKLENRNIKTVNGKTDFFVMVFHFAFHHGFKGMKWMLDICNFIAMNRYCLDEYFTDVTPSMGKIAGLSVMLADEISGSESPSKSEKKKMHLDRLLPFEYRFYKSRLMKNDFGVLNSISHRLVKVLLPYRHRDKFKALSYLLFNMDSIGHRIKTGSGNKKTSAPFSLVRILFKDMIKNIRRGND